MDHFIVKWVKDKSISMVKRIDVLGDTEDVETDSKISVRYDDKILDAVVLHRGDFDQMNHIFEELQPAFGQSKSPKGRGLRMPKRKVDIDFESGEDAVCEELQPRKKRDLQKLSAAASGQDVIDQLLNDREDNTILNVDHISFDCESSLVKDLRDQLSSANQKVKELERLNRTLLTKLPEVVDQLRQYTNLLPKRQPASAQIMSTPSKSSVSPPSSRLSQGRHMPKSSVSMAKECSTSSTATSAPSQLILPEEDLTGFNENGLQEFQIDTQVMRRANQVKGKGKLVCNLMRALFSRDDLATSSLKGKCQAIGKKVLDPSKVEALTKFVLDAYPDADRSFIRIKITEKLKDERKAFFKDNKLKE